MGIPILVVCLQTTRHLLSASSQEKADVGLEPQIYEKGVYALKKKRYLAFLLSLVLLASVVTVPARAEETVKNDNLLRMWYTQPANIDSGIYNYDTSWMAEPLAIGNGYMGGLVFGGITKERIHINEKTIWEGGPKGDGSYNYGNTNPTETEQDLAQIKADLEAIRRKLDDKSEYVFGFSESSYTDHGTDTQGEAMDWLNKLMGNLNGYNAPLDYAEFLMDFSKNGLTDDAAKNYVRDLDMRTALSTVSYDYDGVHYTREYFNSYPDNVLVARLEADKGGQLTFDVELGPSWWFSYYGYKGATAEGDTITMRGVLSDNGLRTEAQLKVLNEGGQLVPNANGTISVTGADAVTLILACGTDYEMSYPDFRSGVDPHEAVTQRVEAAAEKGYEALKRDHVADHSALFSRLELGFNEEIPQIPTDELIQKYRNMVDNNGGEIPTEGEQRALEIMCYQFGRYLTIAGSREGALPTNLQGVWGVGYFNWGGDYHFNINIQMNYWPTMASNLGECLLPYNEYLEALRVAGRQAAASAFGIKSEDGEENGWLVGCFSTPYMFASMGQDNNAAGWNPAGSAWALQNAYEYYLYTGDVDYLRENLYPSMKEVAKFWNEALWWSEAQQRYVSAPSYSPENGPIVNGASYDQQLIWQHFENTIQAAEILGVDADLVQEWRDKQSKMDPVLVGDSGQVKEWFEETTFGKAQAGDLPEIAIPRWRASLGATISGNEPPHRHISQLMALYPGTLINKDNNEYMEAAMVTLDERGLDASGWSKGHKMNLWARTGNGEKTFELVKSAVGGGNAGFLTNLFSSHGAGANYKQSPIFQIDGNFGYTAGINEMLIQSQLGYTQFLPAIPAVWNTGFVKGIVARGNFVIDMDWADGKANFFKVESRNGGTFTGEYDGLSSFMVLNSAGRRVAFTKLSEDKISFETQKGETYTIKPDDGSVDPVDPPVGPVVPSRPSTSQQPVSGLPFTDVSSTASYYDAVKYVYDNGLMNGTGATKFAPNSTLDRAMVVTILHRLEGEPAISYTGKFADVADGIWYTNGVEWAAKNGIVNGYTNGKFGPTDPVTREQLAAILYRYAEYKGYDVSAAVDLTAFADGGSVSAYAAPAVKWAVAEDILETGGNKLRPRDAAIRAEVAVAVAHFHEQYVK